jgi:hypothetical protein
MLFGKEEIEALFHCASTDGDLGKDPVSASRVSRSGVVCCVLGVVLSSFKEHHHTTYASNDQQERDDVVCPPPPTDKTVTS